MSFGCTTCMALEFASEDSLRALVVYQAQQIDALTGGRYEAPSPEELVDYFTDDPEPEPVAPPDVTFVLEALLGHEDIFRKPPRAAAPRLIERLADVGWTLTYEETE